MNSSMNTARRLVHEAAGSARMTEEPDGSTATEFDVEALEKCFRFARTPERLGDIGTAALDEMFVRIREGNLAAAQGAVMLKSRIEASRQRVYRDGPNGLEYIEV